MKIGLFTDTYHPSINGIVYVIDITRKHLEELGHEVYIFCPGGLKRQSDDDHIIRFPSVKGAFYDDYDLTLFFPPQILRKIGSLNLDVIHSFTPGQVGVMAVYAAHKHKIPLVSQHSTDIYEYVEHYPAVLPGLLILATFLPLVFRFDGKDARQLLKLYIPRRGVNKWNRAIIEALVAMLYSRCDIVIALSRKSFKQLADWRNTTGYHYNLRLMPTGVNALPHISTTNLREFRKKFSISNEDEIISYVGRLGAEKNLALLIPMIEEIVQKRPQARLLYVGDFEYREQLEQLAQESSCPERISFTGALPRDTLNQVYQNTSVFVFPSLTDTQGLVLHEAAHAGCPLVVIDKGVSEVIKDGKNGLYAKNTAASLSNAVLSILATPRRINHFSHNSKKLALQYTEQKQVRSLAELYTHISVTRVETPRRHWLKRILKKH
jgi:glycosyltransferase involved in cell wall biosynthesis